MNNYNSSNNNTSANTPNIPTTTPNSSTYHLPGMNQVPYQYMTQEQYLFQQQQQQQQQQMMQEQQQHPQQQQIMQQQQQHPQQQQSPPYYYYYQPAGQMSKYPNAYKYAYMSPQGGVHPPPHPLEQQAQPLYIYQQEPHEMQAHMAYSQNPMLANAKQYQLAAQMGYQQNPMIPMMDSYPYAMQAKQYAKPRMITTMWEDEKTLCYQVEVNGVSVVRRADNDMINGTKLLNVTKMTRGRRDGILRGEKVRNVVKIGSMHLKGVWIPFERAYLIAQKEKIVDLLHPLFVKDIKSFLKQGLVSDGTQVGIEQNQQQSLMGTPYAASAIHQHPVQPVHYAPVLQPVSIADMHMQSEYAAKQQQQQQQQQQSQEAQKPIIQQDSASIQNTPEILAPLISPVEGTTTPSSATLPVVTNQIGSKNTVIESSNQSHLNTHLHQISINNLLGNNEVENNFTDKLSDVSTAPPSVASNRSPTVSSIVSRDSEPIPPSSDSSSLVSNENEKANNNGSKEPSKIPSVENITASDRESSIKTDHQDSDNVKSETGIEQQEKKETTEGVKETTDEDTVTTEPTATEEK